MRTFDLPFNRVCGPDLHVSDAFVEQVPVEGAAELLPVVCLYLLDLEREFGQDVIDELDRDPLVVAGIGTQNPQERAAVDRRALVVAHLLRGLSQGFNELNIDLQLVAGTFASRSASTGSACVSDALIHRPNRMLVL